MLNTYTRVARAIETTGDDFAEIWWCPSILVVGTPFILTINVTAGLAGGAGNDVGLCVYEVSGLTAVDQSGTNNSTASVSALTATNGGADTGAKDFVCAALALGTLASTAINSPLTTQDVNFVSKIQICHQINAASGGTDAAAWTWTTANRCAGVIASFVSAGAVLVQNPNTTVNTVASQPAFFRFTIATQPKAGNALIIAFGLGEGPGVAGAQITGIVDNQNPLVIPHPLVFRGFSR